MTISHQFPPKEHFQHKDRLFMYSDSHHKDKTSNRHIFIMRISLPVRLYLCIENPVHYIAMVRIMQQHRFDRLCFFLSNYCVYITWNPVTSFKIKMGFLKLISRLSLNGTPLCKSNGTFLSDMDINELTSVLHKYETQVTKCCILTCCWVNLVCIRHLTVKIVPERHVWGPDFLMSDSPYIFQFFEN